MVENDKSQEIIGVSQKAIVLNQKGRMLTLFRTEAAPTMPNSWDLPGGDLDFGEDAIEGIKREIKEETGLVVENVTPFDVDAIINPEGSFWITIGYHALALEQDVTLSPEHNNYRWVSSSEFLKINTSRRARRFVERYQDLVPAPKLEEI